MLGGIRMSYRRPQIRRISLSSTKHHHESWLIIPIIPYNTRGHITFTPLLVILPPFAEACFQSWRHIALLNKVPVRVFGIFELIDFCPWCCVESLGYVAELPCIFPSFILLIDLSCFSILKYVYYRHSKFIITFRFRVNRRIALHAILISDYSIGRAIVGLRDPIPASHPVWAKIRLRLLT